MEHSALKLLFLISYITLAYCKRVSETSGKELMSDPISNINGFMDIMDLGRTLGNFTIPGFNLNVPPKNITSPGSGGLCPNDPNLLESLKVPLYIIVPGLIIGILILIKKIGLFTAWIPAVSAKWFKSFKPGYEDQEEGEGWGWGSPSPSYGPPPVPSPAYGQPTNSRQTAILESIDNLNNQYGYPSQPISSNNAGEYASDDAQNYMDYYYNQPQQQLQQSQQQLQQSQPLQQQQSQTQQQQLQQPSYLKTVPLKIK